jgi:flagellar motility protein MotE (MotC chaperone)
MDSVIVLLLIVLIAGVAVVALKAFRPAPASVAAPIDTNAIVASVQTAIDINAIATSVKGAVEAQMLQTATQALANNNKQAEQQANQTLTAQKDALDQQTRLLLKPFEERTRQLLKTNKENRAVDLLEIVRESLPPAAAQQLTNSDVS